MTVSEINSSTFVADLVILIRDKLLSNITDPESSKRATADKFVLTEYPRRAVHYPIITVRDTRIRQEQRLGMQSEGTILRLGVEVRVWARNVVERDEIFDEVHNYLRTNQLGATSLTTANLHDFSISSVTNVSEPDVKSKVLEVSFLFVCE